ncbi:hypothetical protein VP01_1070g2 [Puccinia sorghi]|uniref:Uncharacterized protein n=1 Tax=Puccinia sorghi TaxID=27349 RepID=A0A0L6VV30_9BASI|nr:hypothetical protein VP01_1070g2 [Puccinia sorghi]
MQYMLCLSEVLVQNLAIQQMWVNPQWIDFPHSLQPFLYLKPPITTQTLNASHKSNPALLYSILHQFPSPSLKPGNSCRKMSDLTDSQSSLLTSTRPVNMSEDNVGGQGVGAADGRFFFFFAKDPICICEWLWTDECVAVGD